MQIWIQNGHVLAPKLDMISGSIVNNTLLTCFTYYTVYFFEPQTWLYIGVEADLILET